MKGIFVAFALLLPVAAAGSEPSECPAGASPACVAARAALREAQAGVRAAAEQDALWTTAQEALETAQGAFAKGDYAAACRAAHTAADQARLGIAQTRYPTFQLPKP